MDHLEALEKQVALRLNQPYIKPAPGSPSAKEEGCTCSPKINNNGYGRNSFKGCYVVSSNCPLHRLGRI